MVAAGTASAAEAPEVAAVASNGWSVRDLPLPPPNAGARAREAVRAALHEGTRSVKVAVIDDDPTGTQTVRDVPLLTSWAQPELEWAMREADPLFAILTNSRSLTEPRAAQVNAEIGRLLPGIARRLGFDLRVISRSDSTLRGHFPVETEALAGGLAEAQAPIELVLVCPAYPEAGRVTVDGVHWVNRAGSLTPVAETDYARDAAFGYRSSRLTEWVRERAGEVDVACVAIDDIREGDAERIATLLSDAADDARYVVVDAAESFDLELLAWGLSIAEQRGLRVLCRTGPSFLSARAGLAVAAPLRAEEVAVPGGRGLVVVGSHTDLTNEQLQRARASHALGVVMLDVEWLLSADGASLEEVVSHTVAELQAALVHGDAALVTSRRPLGTALGDRSLEAIATISDAIVAIVRRVADQVRLHWLIAKGGITSNDIASKALGVRRARVLGQIFPGQVSVWELGEGSSLPGLRYVVFPGNVGEQSTLARTIGRLKGVA
jgi:uncharacterized protein YgbK (DUF1537 family)